MKWIASFVYLLLIPSLYGAPLETSEEWDENSDPEIMSYYFKRNFYQLPLKGIVKEKNKYWSADYWPLNKGNINYRWYAKKNKTGFNLKSPDLSTIRKMTIPQLAELSPSEKYDLFTGRYDYPLKKEVEAKSSNPRAQIWEGICHGWAPATMNHPEPHPKLMKNPDGIEIPFGSSDIKALLSYYYANGFLIPDTFQMGRRCFRGRWINRDRECNQDLNAGAFHIVLANRLGIDGIGVIGDLNRYTQVSNKPIISFQSSVLRKSAAGSRSAPGTTEVIRLRTTVNYVKDKGHDWRPVLGTSKQYYKQDIYEYELELNNQGIIIGGEWISSDRPDFLWTIPKQLVFTGLFSRLPELL